VQHPLATDPVCHPREILTAAPGTRINGGAMLVSDALGNSGFNPSAIFSSMTLGPVTGLCRMAG
jgi:hypothetical protein